MSGEHLYVPAAFRWCDRNAVLDFVEQQGLALLLSGGAAPRLTPIPLVLDRTRSCLFGHLARSNPQVEVLRAQAEASVVFNGENAYVSPSWYLEPDGVPTWNYRTVVISGACQLIEDAGNIHAIIGSLTDRHESGFDDPWRMDKLSPRALQAMTRAIIGLRIDIERIEAKTKMSQNRSAASRRAVREALAGSSRAGDREVAAVMDAAGAIGARYKGRAAGSLGPL